MTEPAIARWLRYLVYASALVPLVIFVQYLSPFHFGKVVVLRALVEVMAALYLLLIWRDRSYIPKGHPILWAFWAFTMAFTLTTITSVAPSQSFWGTLERMGGLFTFWHYLVFTLITVSVVRTREHWLTLLNLMVAVGVVSAVYGFLQKTDIGFIIGSGGRARPFGTIGNAALFAGYQILVGWLAVILSFMRPFTRQASSVVAVREHAGLLIGCGTVATLLAAVFLPSHGLWVVPLGIVIYAAYLLTDPTGTASGPYRVAAGAMFLAAAMTAVRGSLLAMVVSALLFVLLRSVFRGSRQAKTVFLGGVGAVALFVFFALLLRATPFVQGSPYLRRITDFSSTTFTVQTRFWAWEAGLKGWADAPRYMLVGWGPENFNIPFAKYFNPKFFTGFGAETFFDRAHNMFIEVLVTMGLVGLLSYLALFGALFWSLAKFMRQDGAARELGMGGAAMTVAYMIHNAFIFDTSANFLTFFTLAGFVVHVAQRGLEEASSEKRIASRVAKESSWTVVQLAVGGVLAIGVAVLVWNTNVVSAKANYATTRAIVAGWRDDIATTVRKFGEALSYDTSIRYEIRHRFAQYLFELNQRMDVKQVPGLSQVVDTAIAEVTLNIGENPPDYLPYLYVSRLNLLLGRDDPRSPYNDRALEYALQALDISPTFIRTYYEIAQAYLNKGDEEAALEWFDKARQLNPDVGVTYWYMAAVQIKRERFTVALGLIEQAVQHGYTLSEGDLVTIGEVYLKLGRLDGLVLVTEQLVMQFPQKQEHWEQLIALYLQLGRREDAITAISEGLRLFGNDPAFRAKAQAALRQLGVQ